MISPLFASAFLITPVFGKNVLWGNILNYVPFSIPKENKEESLLFFVKRVLKNIKMI